MFTYLSQSNKQVSNDLQLVKNTSELLDRFGEQGNFRKHQVHETPGVAQRRLDRPFESLEPGARLRGGDQPGLEGLSRE